MSHPVPRAAEGRQGLKFVADPALKKNVSPQASATLTALKKTYKSLQGAVDAGWRFVDGDGVDVKPGKMSGPHFFIEPGGSVAMSSTTALHAVNE